MRIGILDIETTNLSANYGRVLCAVHKEFGSENYTVLRGDDREYLHEAWSDDSGLVRDIIEDLKQYNILVAHNGVNFDIPFLNTRALYHGLPIIPNKMIVDPCLLARRKLRLNSNGLDSLIRMLSPNGQQKTVINPDIWLRAVMDCDEDAMDYIVEHCVIDVKALEKIYERVMGLVTDINSHGSR